MFTCMSSEPVTTQFFLGTNTAALTGKSQTLDDISLIKIEIVKRVSLFHLKGFDELLAFIIPNVDVAVVERDEHPLLGGVEVA